MARLVAQTSTITPTTTGTKTDTQNNTSGATATLSSSASSNQPAMSTRSNSGNAFGSSNGGGFTAAPAQQTTEQATPTTDNTVAEEPNASSMRTPTTTSSVKSTNKTTTSSFQPQTYTPTGMYDPANLQAYNAQREAQVRQMYADAQQSTLAGLKTAYDQNLSDATAYRDQISPQYQRSMSALGAEYERQRRNNNMQAAANGLNTGAGSQMALAQSANYQANQAGLAAKENQALDEANRRLTDLKTNYQNAIAEATAQNNYKLAASLLDEYQNAYNRQLNVENTNYQREQAIENQNYTRQWNEDERNYSRDTDEAARKASYGDFSGYADLYGEDIARTMELTWAMQNPQIAYAAGKLSAEDYQALTGYAPSGASGSSGYSSSSFGGSGSNNNSAWGLGGYRPIRGRWQNYTPEERESFSMSRIGRGGGRGRGRGGYFGPPGYLNANGEFVVPGTSYGTPRSGDYTSYGGHNASEAQAYNDAAIYAGAYADSVADGNSTYQANKDAQEAIDRYGINN